jgi:hypothetical protein
MADLRPGLRNILDTVAKKTIRSVSWSVTDTVIVQTCEDNNNIPAEEAYSHLLQLEGLNLIKIGVKASGADFRMISITKEGLEESSENQQL